MDNDLDKAMVRARSYPAQDGLYDIFLGVLALLIGLWFFVASMRSCTVFLGFWVISAIPFLCGSWFFSAARARITDSRGGYVRPLRMPFRFHFLWILPSSLMLGPGAVLLQESGQTRFFAAIIGLSMATLWLMLAYHFRTRRYSLLAVVSILAGLVGPLSGVRTWIGIGSYATLMGVACILSGLVVLFMYLKQNPPQAEGET